MRHASLAVLGLVLAATVGARPALAQRSAYRFEISAADDSTFTFSVARDHWVHRGLEGIAVDPREHDALVARFRVVAVDSGRATALVIGQTTRITTDHVALLVRPEAPWYRRGVFWLGALLGAAIGAVAASR